MFDNSITGAVGFAMHADRLVRATRNLRCLEAEQAGTEPAVVRMLRTTRKRDGMEVGTVAGLPIGIRGDTRALGFSGVTRLVRTLSGD
jgi:hypothetical protein